MDYVFEVKAKSQREIKQMEAKREEEKVYAKMVKGYATPIQEKDKYYVVNRKNESVELSELSQQDIYSIAKGAIERIGQQDLVSIKNAHKLLELVEFKPDYDMLIGINEMFYDKKAGCHAKDLLAPIVNDKINTATNIAIFLKQSQGDYTKVSKDNIEQVLRQMKINEQNKSVIKDAVR